MPKLNLGRVVGRDGGFGNIETRYINDGGAPSVTIEAQGEDTAKDFIFTFKNLVRDAATSDELEQIAAGENVQSSNVITALSMSVLWVKMKAAFAAFKHTHPGTDIDGKSITAAQLADHSVGKDQLETAVWESISPTFATRIRVPLTGVNGTAHVTFPDGLFSTHPAAIASVDTAYPHQWFAGVSALAVTGCDITVRCATTTESTAVWVSVVAVGW